jgi:hypothetical protein
VVTIATFDNQIDAFVALGRLQAEGVEAFLADQNLVQMDVLYNIAVGGIKLQVNEDDRVRAEWILSSDYSDLVDDQDETN